MWIVKTIVHLYHLALRAIKITLAYCHEESRGSSGGEKTVADKFHHCIVYLFIYHFFHICDSAWEKGPCRAFFQNRVIATVAKSRL